MKLKWQQAPVKTQWGDEMVVASVAIDKDHTLSLYCERDQATKVETMFVQTAQQEPVVLPCCGFTDARAVRWNFYNKVVQCHNCGQVYTSPPAQRTWVGLTDEEMRELEKQFNAERVRTSDEEYLIIYPGDYWAWQRAIEAKLKEKNNG